MMKINNKKNIKYNVFSVVVKKVDFNIRLQINSTSDFSIFRNTT